MYRNPFPSKVSDLEWPQKLKQQVSLLDKKDQQIRRLQVQLQQQKRRADNAVKMLQNFKSIHVKYQEGSESIRNQMGRRLKAEEEARRAQQRNRELEEGIRKYMGMLAQKNQGLIGERQRVGQGQAQGVSSIL